MTRRKRPHPRGAGLALASILSLISIVPGGIGSARLVTAAEPAPAVLSPYPHKSVKQTELGEGPRSYWLFEPAEPSPEQAPVVVFNHGWFAVNPAVYGAWIEHLVRRGRIVIAPRYQRDLLTPPVNFLPNGLIAVRDALDVLSTSQAHVRPDRTKFALMGHSAGGNLAAQMAAVAAEADLPDPKAVICIFPGEVLQSKRPDLADIPAKTLLVVAAGQKDLVVGDQRAREIFAATTAIPSERKKFVLYRSDLRGYPHFRADHLAPTGLQARFDSGDGLFHSAQMAQCEVNAFDTSGFWRMADLTLDAAFAGRTLDEATNRGDAFRHLGYWSDGRPVLPAIVSDDLALIPRVFPAAGLKGFGRFANSIATAPRDAALTKASAEEITPIARRR